MELKKSLPLDKALSLICNEFQVNLAELSSSAKHKHMVDGRSALALLARMGQQDWNLQNVATLLNKNHGSVSRLASRAEKAPEIISFINKLLSK